MAKIQLEPGDTCEVEDNQESGWNPESIDELIVDLLYSVDPDSWMVECQATGRTGIIHKDYLHFKS